MVTVASTAPSLWAAKQLCATCVTDLAGNTLTITNPNSDVVPRIGDVLTVGQGTSNCQFTVTAVTSTTSIAIATGHNCVAFTGKTLPLHRRSAFAYQITGLAMGVAVNVRVTAHNSLGYGVVSDSIVFSPIVTSDPPPSPDLTLSVLTAAESDSPADRVSSLVVRFMPPKIVSTDVNGNGGQAITKYLVEWSDGDWTTGFTPHIQVISTTSSGGHLSGSFRLQLDTTACTNCQVQGPFTTSAITVDASPSDLTTILQNMPNIGNVRVTLGNGGACSANIECTWIVTFLSELGAVPAFTVADNRIRSDQGLATITVSSSVAQGGQVGSLNGNIYCPTTGGASGRASCGVVTVTPSSPLPLRYVIQGLTAGTAYFVRVSAFNDLGYGIRRLSAPASVSVPFEAPTLPSSLFSAISKPVLTLAGPTSLLVSYGPPSFDGGSPVTAYAIEWDPMPSFDSGTSGDALGDTVVTGGAGGQYTITGLTIGTYYYVRVYAMNAQVGAGLPMPTEPAREMPRSKPAAPQDVSVENNKQLTPLGSSLTVRWRAPADVWASVSNYRIEWYQRALAAPFFGVQAIQRVETDGTTITGGSFTLAFGAEADFRTLPGTISVVQGQNFITTTADLTGLLSRGDVLLIDGRQYLVAAIGAFTPTRIPVADTTDPALTLASGLGTSATLYTGNTKSGLPLLTPWKTIPLRFDITPSAMKEALEMLPSVLGLVHVERVQTGATSKYRWLITFSSQVPSPSALPALIVNDRNLVGTGNLDATVTVQQVGQAPLAFGSAVVAAPDSRAGSSGVVAFNITRLTMGTLYFVRVAAQNDRGFGGFAAASVVDGSGSLLPWATGLAPTRVPFAMDNAWLRTLSRSKVELVFDQTRVSGGQLVTQYVVEYDTSFQFNSLSKKSLTLAPTTTFHRVTTSAHTGPFVAGSTFTLSTIDDAQGFKGSFTVQVDAFASGALLGTTGFLTRVLPSATTGIGGADFSIVFSRGEHVRVRNSDARVCLDSAVKFMLTDGVVTASYDDTTKLLTLAAALTPAMAVYVVQATVMSIGASCRASIDVVVSTTQLQIRHTCAPAMLTPPGQAVYVHWGPAVLPLCAATDPWAPLDATARATFVAQLGTITDPLALFQLDTSVGVAVDLVASSANAGGSTDRVSLLNDLTIECGDFVRLGDPSSGPIFRVRGKCVGVNCRCDIPAAVDALQLGDVADFSVPVSLASESLGSATREIQTLSFSTATGDLVHGKGGFRLKFGDEISATSLRGGNGGVSLNDDVGCLLWSSGPLSTDAARDISSLEAELESFDMIDDVRVTRTLSTSPTVLTYVIEFLGVKVRGKLPTLVIQDIGTNGCSAFDATGPIVAPTVDKIQDSYATIYKAPTTQPIPFDATGVDVKAALEQLSSVSNVDVTRVVNKNGFDWRVTHVAFDDARVAPTIAANGFALLATQDPRVAVTTFNELQLDAVAAPGVSLFARVTARNAVGLGDAAVPVPSSVQPSNQLPGVVARPRVQVVSDTEARVEWAYPREDGGLDVTEYKVEWWSATVNGGAKQSQVIHHLESAPAVADVNTISISAPVVGTVGYTFLSGTFQVGFDGQWTPQLAYDTSAIVMEAALRNLSTIEKTPGGLSVTRVLDTNGYTWIVTFAGQTKYGVGDQHRFRLSQLDQRKAHKLEVKDQNLLVCNSAQRDVCLRKRTNGIAASVAVGTTTEVQTLSCVATPAPSAALTFTLTYMGVTTAAIASNGDAAVLEAKINAILVAGRVAVRFRDPAQTTLCVAANPSLIEIEFTTERGDVPMFVTGSVSTGLTIAVTEARKGRPQRVIGRMPYSYLISGLTPGASYNVRVAAYNSLGYGAFRLAQPEQRGLVPAPCVPTMPQSLSVRTRLSSSSLLVVWEEPESSGGTAVASYRVEWDSSPSFTSLCGEGSEVQTLVLSHTALPATGTSYKLWLGSTFVGCMAWQTSGADMQAAIRALGGVYANAEVSVFGDDSARWDFGHTYTVTFVNPVTTATSSFPLQIPLFVVDRTGPTCMDYPGTIVVDRARFGPGQDTKLAQGKVDNSHNECAAWLEEPLGKQTIADATALANGVAPQALQLALATQFSAADGSDNVVLGAHARVLCASCVQKMAGNTLTVTASLVTTLAAGSYVIVEEVLVPAVSPTSLTPATVGRKCVLKALAVAADSITFDATDAAFAGGAGCQLPAAFESVAWQLKRFNLRAHTITDLFPGREYAVRVVATNALGESVAAIV